MFYFYSKAVSISQLGLELGMPHIKNGSKDTQIAAYEGINNELINSG